MTGLKIPLIVLLLLSSVAGVLSTGSALAGGNSGAVGAGGAHSCAVTPSGGAKCWGANESGQLGNDSNAGSMTPVDVRGLTSGVESIAGGLSFTCALTTSGGVKCWGRNANGQLGAATTDTCGAVDCSRVPIDVVGLSSGVAEISAGWAHACARMDNGAVKCWGNNTFGQLGNGNMGHTDTPVDVDLPEGATAIAAGGYFTCALTTTGAVKCWGDNTFGQLGDGTEEDRASPTQVTGLSSGASGVGAGGGGHACALMVAGGAKCWGNNEYGQLGVNPDDCHTPCTTPVDVVNLGDHLMAISGGYFFTCAVTDGGAVKCWGRNEFGQLGDELGCGSLCYGPVNVLGLSSGVINIATGSTHACARLTAGVRCWGDNFDGQVGDGGKCGTICPSPMDVFGLLGATGDVNCDHSVNSIDAALVLQLGAGLLSSLACGPAADTNHDGSVNSIDAALILQFVAGLVHSLP